VIKPLPFAERETSLLQQPDHFAGAFFAMGCPCQVLIETGDRGLAEELVSLVRNEAFRIEAHWSRYLPTSLVQQINTNPTSVRQVDAETALILDYCEELWRLSDAAFDITSGVLRTVWNFDGGSRIPHEDDVNRVLEQVGWHRVSWQNSSLLLADQMELDLGGVGKEYAVDLCCRKLRSRTSVSCLVNFGGDCAVTTPPKIQRGWRIGVESSSRLGTATETIELSTGALATSGDVYRYVMNGDRKLSHILDARTGWPVIDAPASLTVAAETCLQAGMLATLACQQGADAESLLESEGISFHIQRHQSVPIKK